MKIGLISTALPNVKGGYRFIVDWLEAELASRGHAVETIYLPHVEDLDQLLAQMVAFRSIKLDNYFDRVITFRPPAHMVQHPRKVVWFIHHHRFLYDLWQTPYCPVPDGIASRSLRAQVFAADRIGLSEAHALFANSSTVAARLRRFNELESEVLYPPVNAPARFRSGYYGDEIVSVCRMEHHKRQHLLIEALAETKTPVRLRLCGASLDPVYVNELSSSARRLNVADRVILDNRWIGEDEKVDRLETALASVYLPVDEDSYGYPTIEAAHAQRCTLTTTDSGGVLEFVEDSVSGLVSEPQPAAIAHQMDKLFSDKRLAERLGQGARDRVVALGIDWDFVVEKLLA